MLNWLKKLTGTDNNNIENTSDYSFTWYEIGDVENPFNKRILDIRSFTQTVVATTSDQFVAVSFNANRTSNGEEFRAEEIPESETVKTNLVYPHNGKSLEGVIFKAQEMEDKWDIYFYDSYFFFVRSWTGKLVYKAQAEILSDKIIINQISYSHGVDGVDAVNSVHFLMKSHAFGQAFPHYVINTGLDEKMIAQISFSQFGNRACYACLDEVLDTTVFGK